MWVWSGRFGCELDAQDLDTTTSHRQRTRREKKEEYLCDMRGEQR
jgi:hypothetical protein